MDDLAPDVPTSCVVYIATTDGVLRMCHLANFKREQGLARDPAPVPAALPAELAAALEAAGRLAALDEVRAGNTCTCACRRHACNTHAAGCFVAHVCVAVTLLKG
jgi:hypothetical protein